MILPRTLGVLVAGLTLAACAGPSEPDDDPRARLEAARRLWRSQGYDSYGYDYQNVCFCVDREAVRILVLRGHKTSILTPDGRPVDPARFPFYRTVDEAFTLIEDAYARRAAQVRAEYDPRLGYPVEVFVDYDAGLADEEQGLRISGLLPLRE